MEPLPTRYRGSWTAKRMAYFQVVQCIMNGLRDYWPLTLRQVYYQLVAGGHIENNDSAYQKLSRVLTHARLDRLIPWEAMEDRSRSRLAAGGWSGPGEFVQDEQDGFLQGYRRDLLQDQDVALEVWIEKDALSHVCQRAANPYCVDVVVAKGFSSMSYLHECRQRVISNYRNAGRHTKILYFGDLDPSGWEMLPAMMGTLCGEMGLGAQIIGQRYALTPEQVLELNLPQSIDAIKDTDTRTPKYKAMLRAAGHPETLAVELDALTPAALEGMVRNAIEGNLDLSQFEAQKAQQEADEAKIQELHEQVQHLLEGVRLADDNGEGSDISQNGT